MALSNAEIMQLYAVTGLGKMPLVGGPSTSLRPTISLSIPVEIAGNNASLTSGVLTLTPMYIPSGQTISNINMVTSGAASSPTHFWYALYDDGRGSSIVGQLALLGQTADQLTAAISGASNIGLSLNTPWVTQYSGIYYVGVMVTHSGSPTFCCTSRSTAGMPALVSGTATFAFIGANSLTTTAPNPSGSGGALSNSLLAWVS